MVKEVNSGQGTTTTYGASVESFHARHRLEPQSLGQAFNLNSTSFIISLVSLALLVILVFYQGIRHINKGQVEWKRAIFIMLSVGLGFFGWRVIYMINTVNPFFSETGTLVFLFNQLITGGACGLYAAFAYIGWEALARSQNQEQVQLFDGFWRKRFFFRETGEGLVRGYALGGALLGMFALLLYLMDTVYYQADSQFGFAEAAMEPKLLTLNMSAWLNTWLVALGHAGIAIGFLMEKLKKEWQIYAFGVPVLGVLFGGSAILVGLSGPVWYNVIVLGLMAPVIIFVLKKSGLFTFSTGWWFFVVVLMIVPYWGSPSLDVAYISWVQGSVLLIPLGYGFIAYQYGKPISEMGGYIPEYQERMANQLRVEKEIEIARESQFRLMPLRPPSLSEVDVYGFFMPSFEVGGDYFDYVVTRNGTMEPHRLTMTIADVSGKSMKAAMHAVFTSGLLLSRLHRDPPESILREVAPTLFERTDPQTFITCIIAQYSLDNKKLHIANAGHCLPILKRDGKAEFIHTPAPRFPLGLRTEVGYEPLSLTLEKDDFVLLYSDGLPEAVDPQGNRFGFNEVLELVEELDTERFTSNEIALEIKRRIQKFSDYQLADDTTIICLKV